MKAQYVYENISFERGQDPKRSMEVGLVGGARGVKDFWTYRNRQDVLLDEDEAIEAISPHISERQALNTVVEFDDNSMLRLEYPMEEQTPLLYRGNYYQYKIGPGRRRGYVKVDLKESVNFQRGKDPIKSLDIGFDKAFELDHDDSDLKAWKYGDLVFILAQESKRPYPWEVLVLSEDETVEETIDFIKDREDINDVIDDAKRIIKKWLSKNESVNFERGKDPKDAMNIGEAQIRNMIKNQIKDLSGVDLDDEVEWSYKYTKVKGYDAFEISMTYDKSTIYMVLVPGLFCSKTFSSPDTARDHAEFNLHGSAI